MRKFKFLDPPDERNPNGKEIKVTEQDIKILYYPYWEKKMKEAGKEDLISFENCLEDWIIINWAEEIKDK